MKDVSSRPELFIDNIYTYAVCVWKTGATFPV